MPGVLAEIVDLLRCPVCGGGLAVDGEVAVGTGVTLRCPVGHSFDIARQGYVNLVPGRADTPEMVEAREAFLRAGHFRPLAAALAEEARAAGGGAVPTSGRSTSGGAVAAGGVGAAAGASAGEPVAAGVVVDLGAGTGHHLARTLDALPGARGIGVDASPAALRRAARAHGRAAAVGADVWKPLPLRDGIASIVLSVFAPRNAGEMARILRPAARGSAGGMLLAVTPTTRHLHELVGPLGLLSVPGDKEDRLDAQLAEHFTLTARRTVEHAMFLTREESAQLVRMGPSAWHVDERTVEEGLARLPDPLTVTASVTVSVFGRRTP
jgi:23S rRNA (guanine745-N1)-methyltransferase